jgi:N-acetylglucosamine kinase-like BadF-type ATPase
MAVFLGLDCGGSKTHAVACEGGRAVFEGRGGPANWATTPKDTIKESIAKALEGAPKVEAVCGCFAGLLSEGDKRESEALLMEVCGVGRAEARPDFHAAWEVAKDHADVLVIAGTGALVCSERDGAIVKSGGGGVLFGDKGSAASVGRHALHGQIVSAALFPATPAFWSQVETTFQTKDPQHVLAALYESHAPAMLFASLARVVAEDSDKDEPYANLAMIEWSGALKSELIGHVAKYQPKKVHGLRVGLAGGLWKVHPLFLQKFADPTDTGTGSWSYTVIEEEPAVGACRLAAKL